eukprot:g3928.t1
MKMYNNAREKSGKFITNRWTQGVIYFGLFIALFGLDFYVVTDVHDDYNHGMYVTLNVIFVVFIVEIIVQTWCFTEEYWDGGVGFYFWTDFVGTVSMIFDIPWFNPLGGTASNQGGILRASKAARVGARVARLLKLTRAIKMMRAMRVQSILKAVADVVTEQIARKIAMLVMLMAIIVPLFNISERDRTLEALMGTFETMAEADGQIPFSVSFETEYINPIWEDPLSEGTPFKVEYVNATGDGGAVLRLWEKPNFDSDFNRESSIIKYYSPDDSFVAYADNSSNEVILAWINIVMVLIVVAMLMLFSTLLHGVVMKGVINPMERIFTTINEAMQGAFDMDQDEVDTNKKATTAKALEESVARLARILKSRERSGVEDALEEGNEEQNKWVLQTTSRDFHAAKLRDKKAGGRQSMVQRPSILALMTEDLSPKSSRPELRAVRNWGYNCYEYDNKTLMEQSVSMITQLGFDKQFNVEFRVIHLFVKKISMQYKDNPYHNFRHGVDVMQSVFWMARTIDYEKHLPPLEMFALISAALAHDVGHLGVNNAFLVNTGAPLAMRYNDISVLENMHASVMFETMGSTKPSGRATDCNLFGGLSDTDWVLARKTAVKAILATDNSHHFKAINDIKVTLEVHSERHKQGKSIFIDNEKQRVFLCGLLLHMSDISNPMREWEASSKSAFNIMEEFFSQGDQEKKFNMKVSMLCDREKENIPKAQMGFIDFFISPLVEQFLRLFPEVGPAYAQNLCANRKNWQNMFLETSKLDGAEKEQKERDLNAGYNKWRAKFDKFLGVDPSVASEVSKEGESTGSRGGADGEFDKGTEEAVFGCGDCVAA